ncbi:TonB-dependent siderophore receptor [Burkholderia sp. Ac-20379]|uniref:TonB-dependent siderophore receptor n=1 Tax=Burkholderia sp. Ac-20379 TaxID=2703900 RepID=UPI00198088B1|nr:TonB-dependent receptor [Burkholderia sp. Ac-20379]MBN3724641.1 TonB-dependent siderophore receptor [Burkholderia sp. Ac-20379]
MTSAAHAGSTPTMAIDVPAQPLDHALAALSQQTGIALAYSKREVAGKVAPEVKGTLAARDALDKLLAGTQLSVVQDGQAGLRVVRDSSGVGADAAATSASGSAATDAASKSVALPAVKVSGKNPEVERVNPPVTVGSKIPVAQREIPQSVSVITQQQIDLQNASTLADVMRYTPGIQVMPVGSNTNSYISRGFPITSFQLDGVPTALGSSSIGAVDDNIAMYDRVEVLRGPAGLFNGFGGDGGVINLVRKRAPSTFQASAEVGVGNYADHRESIDIGGPLNKAGTLRGRLVAAQHDQHLMQDGTWQRDQQIYGTLEADLTSTTTARVGVAYSKQFGHVMYGLPVSTDHEPITVSRSAFLGADWNYYQLEKTNEFVEVEQKLPSDWVAKVAYNHVQYNQHAMYGIPNSYVDPTTFIGNPYSLNYSDKNTQDSVDAYASGPFSLFGRKHKLTVGASYLRQNDKSYQYLINPASGLDFNGDQIGSIFDNSIYSDAFAGGPQANQFTLTNQYSVYGNARFSILDPLTLVVGGQLTWWNSTVSPDVNPDYNFFGVTYQHASAGPKFNPFVGLVYDINDTYTAYASYTSIYKPQTGQTTYDGQILKPVTGSQYEVGIKGEYFGGKLNTALALFQIDESNRAYGDTAHPGFYIATGKARSQGFEATASGELLPGLTLQTGYTYVNVRSLDTSLTTGGNFSWQPKHQFKFWANYQLPGQWHKWNVGGGALVQSSTYSLDGGIPEAAGGYTIFSGLVGYQISKNLSATLSATNIFNRKYWQNVTLGNGNYYGNPAQVMFTLRAKI